MKERNSPPRKTPQSTSIRHRLLMVAVAFCSLGAPGLARAATYYLNTASGNDSNPGTSSAPWQSLAKVQSSAAAGDVIVIQSADVSTYAALWPTHVSYRARVLRQFEITWTFDTEYQVGQFANRDLWVVGPVKIVGIDPPSTSVSGRIINGSMVNPPTGYTAQGYDSAMPDNTYDAAMNVAYNRSASNPLVLAAHSSLISSISMPTVGGKTTLQRAAILTVLAAPARDGDFRPPYCGTNKTPRFNVSMLNRSLLRSLPRVSATPALSEAEAMFAAPWIDHRAGWVGDQMHPRDNMPDYGREIHTWVGIAGLMLHLNFSLEQKEILLRRYIQLGIDWYGVVSNGGTNNWPNAGGHGGGRKWPILFAGIMLNDAAMKAIGAKSGDYLNQNGYGPGHVPPDYVHFGEDDQTFYVAQVDVDATHSSNWHPDSRDATRIPYETSDIGLPEWGIERSTDPYQSNKWLPTMYRGVAGPPFHGTALAALLIPGAKALWNHNAYFDYTDRYMVFTGPGGEYEGWWHSMSTFTDQMWDTYRAQFGPVWPNVGSSAPVLTPIGNQQVTTGETLRLTLSATGGSGTMTYSASGLPAGATFSGNTFAWTPGATQTGTYQVTFTVSDGSAQDSETITITVYKANSPPVLAAIGDQSVEENQLLTFTISATDADGNPITYSASGLPSGASLTGQTFSWTPTYDQAGSYNVTFIASDGQTQDSETITLTVANGDRPPVLAQVADQTVNVGSPVSFTLSATDPDGDSLTYAGSPLPGGATLTGQTFTWTPTSTQAGSYTITFTASDGTLTSSQTASIVVLTSNAPPALAAIGNKSVNENQPLTFTLSATDPDNSVLTYSATGLPSGASLTGPTFSWTPTYAQAGNYSVTFTASDGQAQDSQTVTITVVNVDRPPVLADIGGKSVNVAQPLSFALSATDPDGDRLTFSAGALPNGATLTGQTFAWTPTSGQAGSYPVTFTVSDGTLTDSKTAIITVTSAADDQIVPVVAQCSPAPDAIQVPLNNLMTLHITDANAGVDANSVAIRVNGSLVYQGNVDAYTSDSGRCNRTGTQSDYGFTYQANAPFDFDQTITVSVNAADLAGNAMSEYTYSFTTQMRAFGKNLPVSTLGGSADSRPATACDPAGNIWVAWHAGAAGSRDIYVAKLPVGTTTFQAPIRLTSDARDQCNPALAVDATGTVYVVWQDNRNGNWDLYASLCSNGSNFPKEVRVTSSDHNEINPALALDRQSPACAYVAWQDDRNGNRDIYVAKSTDGFASSTVAQITSNAADQVEPKVVVDSGNVAYLFWTDMRNGQADIYAAASGGSTGAWAEVAVVAGPGPETQPAVAVGQDMVLHLLWVDESSGNKDVYYALLNGLPSSPVAGINIVDDTSGADQTAPAIVCSADKRVFACWTDARHTGADDTDTDLYVAELRAGTVGTNVFVGDSGTGANQSAPAIDVDYYGQPYVVWTDSRQATTEIYYAATTFVDPTPLDSKVVVASVGATVGADPAAIKTVQDVSLVIPAGAYPTDLSVTISRVLNPEVSPAALLGSYDFGPSGVNFNQPVTVTIPYAVTPTTRRVLPYWYDSVTGVLSQQGITDVQNRNLSPKLSVLQFRTTHFTPYYLVNVDVEAVPGDGGSSGGGCAVSVAGDGSPGQLLVPYGAIAAICLILRRRDRRNRMIRQ
jgi:PKD repeat protein